MKVTAKVDPVDVHLLLTKHLPEAVQQASLFAVQTAIHPSVGMMELDYKTLPVRHVEEQRRHQSRPASRKNGSPRPHIWEDIRAKFGNYRAMLGAWAVAGSGARQPHAHLIEAGTKARYTKAGHYRGIMPAFRVVLKIRNAQEKYITDTVSNVFVAKINALTG